MSADIAVFGATGHTGGFVIQELVGRGYRPIAVSRSGGSPLLAVAELRTRQARIDDPSSLDRAFEGALAVINCAGPFLETAAPVASAAVRAGAHYLDVSAEQASTMMVLDDMDAPAREARVVAMPAMAFYGGLVDLLVTAAMGDWTTAADIEVGIALDSWRPTLGTRITGQRNTARRMVIRDSRLVPLMQPEQDKTWNFSSDFGKQAMAEIPFSEAPLIARHLRVGTLRTYLNLRAVEDIRNPDTPPPLPADPSGRSAQKFTIDVRARQEDVERRIVIGGRDIYGSTAPLVVEALERILNAYSGLAGAHAPGAIFDAMAFLSALQLRGDLSLSDHSIIATQGHTESART